MARSLVNRQKPYPGRPGPLPGPGGRLAFIVSVFALFLLHPPIAGALTTEELVLVTNRNVSESARLARYYGKMRGVPPANRLELRTSSKEQISREDFDREIAGPLRAFLKKSDPAGTRFKGILVFYGIPLRVLSPALTDAERAEVFDLERCHRDLVKRIESLEKAKKGEAQDLRKEAETLQGRIRQLKKTLQGAAVDSELALVREDRYPLQGWIPNRFFAGFRGKTTAGMPRKVMLVSRLDGPSAPVVRRIIDDSIAAEKTGLAGKAYFDARWPDTGQGSASFYATYDRAIHNTARLLEKNAKLPVVLNAEEALFQQGEAPDAALYCGWYSLGKYVDAFTWARGAIGFHVASMECATLKNKSSTVWCKTMLEKGAAATLGPVAEPYLQSFPVPEIFFGCLADGRATLAECYALANPFWSWQMVLIGDPLYRPFRKRSR